MAFDYAQLWNDAKKSNLEKYISDNLSTNNIALGFLDSVGKKDSTALQNAIAHSQNAGNARESEAANMAAQQEQNMINAKMQRDQASYAAEGNARMMLLQKSNEITGQINDIYKAYDYTSNPHKYKNALNELTRQKTEVDNQLKASTEKQENNPHYQGETLVKPITAKDPLTSLAPEMEGEINAVSNFLGEKFDAMSEVNLDKTTPNQLYKEIKSQIPDLQMSEKEFGDLYKDYYGYYKEPYNRASETIKRNMGVSLAQQEYQIKNVENQIALATVLANANDLENAKSIMKGLGIRENTPFWNWGIKNHGNAAAQFLGNAIIKNKEESKANDFDYSGKDNEEF